jgi:hypothetical protein
VHLQSYEYLPLRFIGQLLQTKSFCPATAFFLLHEEYNNAQ